MSIVTDSAFSVNGGRAAEQKRLYNLAFLERNYAILEHVLLLSAIKSYKFYALNKQRLCPRLPDGRTFRYDFTLLEYNQVYSIVGQFWETMGSMLKLTDASINADLMELQLGKRVQNGSMSGDDAHAIAKWLLLDIRTIDIAPELILTVTNTQIFNTWIEQRVIEYEQGRLRGISACRRPSLEDFEESFKAVQAARSGDVPLARRLADIPAPPQEDPNELIKHRFLCRGGGLLIAGSTGIGKSVLDNQFSISWGAGRACFGIVPTRPLKSVIIQAEDDDGDLAEMFGGVCNHLKFTPAEFELVRENVITVHDNMHSGLSFFTKVVEPVLEAYRPDLLHINPALAYLGGEANSQKDVGAFLRNHLNPLLTKYNCAAVITTHTNKPPAGKERPDWQAGDFAYAGTGSSEWANWPRGILP